NPTFEDMKFVVMLSSEGETIHFVTEQPGEAAFREINIEPRRSATDSSPVIGVLPATKPKLLFPQTAKFLTSPVLLNSPAAAARELHLQPGDVVLAATDPDNPSQLKELPRAKGQVGTNFMVLSDWLMRLKGKPFIVRVRKASGETKEQDLDPQGF